MVRPLATMYMVEIAKIHLRYIQISLKSAFSSSGSISRKSPGAMFSSSASAPIRVTGLPPSVDGITTFPDGSVAYDTLECPLADPAGRWYGKRVGRYVDSRYRLRGTSARFPMEGLYRFEVVNGMRDSAIAGLKDISLRIEYAKKK